MSQTNTAAWLDKVEAPLRVGTSPYTHPAASEVLIRVHAVAINPVDAYQQAAGIMIESYPFVGGYDLAGEIVEIGANVTKLSVGQRVIAQAQGSTATKTSTGPYQHFVIASQLPVCPIPNGMSFEAACVLPLCLSTAAAGMYPSTHLALPYPSVSPSKSGKALLVWGGSSSVGCCAIQLGVASGLDVITTSSPRNFELCKKLGATAVFDHSSENIVQELTAALENGQCAGCYNAIATPDSMAKTAQILANLGGGFIASVLPPDEAGLPEGVTSKWFHAGNYLHEEPEVAKAVWEDFLPEALASGHLVPAPEAQVVGKGLEAIDGALATWRKGVSAKKIVVSL